MRLVVTVVAPAARRSADIMLDADPATPVAEIAGALERFALGSSAQGTGRVLQFPAQRANGSLALSAPLPREEPAGVPLYIACKQVSPRTTVAESPIKDGAVISLGSPEGCMMPESVGLVEIRVVAGPRTGAIHRLSAGQADIGSSPANDGAPRVRVHDPTVPDYAARIAVNSRGHCQVVAYSGVPVTLDRVPLTGPAQWLPGQQLAIGETLLMLVPYQPPDAALTRSADGAGIDFNRPPRLLPPQRATTFTLPTPPPTPERRPLPVLMVLLPLVMGVGMAFLLRQVYLLAMAGLSPVMLISSTLSERRQGRRSTAARQAEYAEHKARIEADATDAVNAERTALREQCPDPASVLAIVVGPRRRLWERRRTDPDYLLLRVGIADLPSAVRLTDPVQDEHRRTVAWPLSDAPVTIPLAERKVIGLAGPSDSGRALGRWLVAQAAALHSPNDLRIYILTDSTGKASWQWGRWLPHCRPGTGAGSAAASEADQANAGYAAQVGNDPETVASRIAELLSIIAQRQAATRRHETAGGNGPSRFRTEIVVVLDGSRKLRSLPGVIQLLREGPDMGVYAICLDTDERLLPAECQAVAVLGPDGLRVQQMMAATVTGARPDHVMPGWCVRMARAIAPIRDVSADEDGDGLPGAVRLLDVLDLDDGAPMARAIAARWRAGGRSTVAMVGESYDGPFGIDMKKDGPHGLIAGTTGSGKSELLQSLVASLAVANRPDEMTFVLIDYKGGSAFADCARLPHTVGMVTDLSPHLVERALRSLTAELTRREHLLARTGAKDIEDYQRDRDKFPQEEGIAALPRLVIVIDEFASMVRDLPDFVTGLVNIAQRGRSLGIHLILATQRPSGVVSADIRANTNLRIALRVTDPSESADVVDAPDAARIGKGTPGRGYVRLGHASLIPFQSGRVGGPRPAHGRAGVNPGGPVRSAGSMRGEKVIRGPGFPRETGRAGADAGESATRGVWLTAVSWADVGRPTLTPPVARRAEDEITDLKVLAEEIGQAAAALSIPAQPSPWLPPLPDSVQLSDIWPRASRPPAGAGGQASVHGGADQQADGSRESSRVAAGAARGLRGGQEESGPDGVTPVPFGIEDLPDVQLQRGADLDPRIFSHLMAAGAPRSGRSQLLRTIAGALALGHSCADVHLYGLDCGNGALLPLADLPHCGAVAGRGEAERAGRLLRRLDAELTRRQDLLATGGFADITEQRAAAASAASAALAGADLGADLGADPGTGGGMPLPHVFLLLDRWEGFTATFGELDGGALTDVITRILSEGASAGLHLVMTGDRSLLAGRISALCESKLVFRLAEREDYALAGLRARDLPESIPVGRAFRTGSGVEVQVALLGPDASGPGQGAALRSVAASCAARDGAVAAAQRPFRVDAAPGRITFEQAWALRPAASSAGLFGLVGVGGDSLAGLGPDLSVGVPAFVVAGPGGSGRSSVLAAMARSFLAAGTRVVLVTPRPSPLRSLEGLAGVVRVFASGGDLGEEELAECLGSFSSAGVVIVDDAELLRDCDASGVLGRLVSGSAAAAEPGRALVFAGDPDAGLCAGFGGWQVDAKRSRRGVLTAPSSLPEGELIGVRLNRSMVGQAARPGRCLLNVGDGVLVTVTVPLG